MARRALFLFLLSMACESGPRVAAKQEAARFLTQRYAQAPLAAWGVRASAAGSDCDVLLVRTSVVMNDSMVESLHYGAGDLALVDGGVQRFYRTRAFRGAVYRDSAEHVWAYGVSSMDAEQLKPCG